MAYVDLDSLRADGEYRVAVFLTIYAAPIPNSHSIKLDRIVQETAFDCAKHTYSLLSTVGYFAGKEVGKSSDRGNWREMFKGTPRDPVSRRAFGLVCQSPIAGHPEVTAPQDSPAVVTFPSRE